MKTYFIAGYHDFKGKVPNRPFWRLVNIDDRNRDHHDVLNDLTHEAVAHNENTAYYDCQYIVGTVFITAFNTV